MKRRGFLKSLLGVPAVVVAGKAVGSVADHITPVEEVVSHVKEVVSENPLLRGEVGRYNGIGLEYDADTYLTLSCIEIVSFANFKLDKD